MNQVEGKMDDVVVIQRLLFSNIVRKNLRLVVELYRLTNNSEDTNNYVLFTFACFFSSFKSIWCIILLEKI
jgi:hypothetical protein